MSAIQVAALEAAHTIVTEGLGEKRIAAHGVFIVVGNAEEILAGVETVDNVYFQCKIGTFRCDLDRRDYKMDIRKCTSSRSPQYSMLCNLCGEDGAVIVDKGTGQVVCGGFILQNVSGSYASGEARTRAASAMGAMGYYVVTASELICGSIDNPPPEDAQFNVFDESHMPTRVLVRHTVAALREKERAVEQRVKKIQMLIDNYRRFLIPHRFRRKSTVYSVALDLVSHYDSSADYSQKRLDEYREAHDELNRFCKDLVRSDMRERKGIAAVISAHDETVADILVGDHLATFSIHQAELFFHPSMDGLKLCFGARSPRLIIFQGCISPDAGTQRQMRLRFWKDQNDKVEDVDADKLGSLLSLTQSECVLLNAEDSVNLYHAGYFPKNIKVIAWRSCDSCLVFNRRFLRSFRQGLIVRNFPLVESAYLFACEEIAVSLDGEVREFPVTMYHSQHEKDLTEYLERIEPKQVTYRLRFNRKTMTDEDIEDAWSYVDRIRDLLCLPPFGLELRAIIRLEGNLTKGKLEEANKIVEDLRFMGVTVEVKHGSILLDCRVRDVEAFRFYVCRKIPFTSVIPSDVFVDTNVLKQLNQEDSSTVKKVIAVLEKSPIPGERVLAGLLRPAYELTCSQIKDAVEQQLVRGFFTTGWHKGHRQFMPPQRVDDLVPSSTEHTISAIQLAELEAARMVLTVGLQ